MTVKLRLMTHFWRLQQSQVLISMILWATLLTLTSYQYIGWRLGNNMYLGFIVLFVIIFSAILLVGFVFDVVFKLWKEQSIVLIERNPYYKEMLFPKELMVWKHLHIPILKSQNPRYKKDVELMERWIERSMQNPRIKKDIEELEKWLRD